MSKYKKLAEDLFSESDDNGIDNYEFEKFIDYYMSLFLPKIIDQFDFIWNNQRENVRSYGDIDWSIEKIINGSRRILYVKNNVSCADTTQFLVIKEKNSIKEKIHIRTVWDNKSTDYKKNNKYIHRPNLKWYKDREFNLEYVESLHNTALGGSYGDCRDSGYVLTASKYYFDDCYSLERGVIYNYSNLKRMMWDYFGCNYELKKAK